MSISFSSIRFGSNEAVDVLDQEVAVWPANVTSDLKLPVLDEDGIWTDDENTDDDTLPTKYDSKGKGKQVSPVEVSGRSDERNTSKKRKNIGNANTIAAKKKRHKREGASKPSAKKQKSHKKHR